MQKNIQKWVWNIQIYVRQQFACKWKINRTISLKNPKKNISYFLILVIEKSADNPSLRPLYRIREADYQIRKVKSPVQPVPKTGSILSSDAEEKLEIFKIYSRQSYAAKFIEINYHKCKTITAREIRLVKRCIFRCKECSTGRDSSDSDSFNSKGRFNNGLRSNTRRNTKYPKLCPGSWSSFAFTDCHDWRIRNCCCKLILNLKVLPSSFPRVQQSPFARQKRRPG